MENSERGVKGSMGSIGEKLRNARDKKSVTIDQVQKQTHIHSTVLTALEEGRCDELLTPTYVKSFLKKYSQYLGLDAKEILKEYAADHPEEPREKPAETGTRFEPRGADAVSKFIYSLSSVLLLIAFLFLVIFIAKKVTPSLKRHKKIRVVSTTAGIKPVRAGKVSTQSKIQDKYQAALLPQVSTPKKSSFKLVLKVKHSVRVKIKKDGVLLFDRFLPKGSVESFTAEDKIEMYVAKGESIELILNDQALGSPGKGLIKNLEITSNGIKIK